MARSRRAEGPPHPPGTRFVLDCAVALAWFFEDETDEYADAVQLAFPTCSAVVPAI